jgi:L-alanine-DL-glutamate epimerase-like enolase superfamily enzyme
LRLKGDFTNFHTFIKGAKVTLPAGPGLGLEVDEKKVRAAAVASCKVE